MKLSFHYFFEFRLLFHIHFLDIIFVVVTVISSQRFQVTKMYSNLYYTFWYFYWLPQFFGPQQLILCNYCRRFCNRYYSNNYCFHIPESLQYSKSLYFCILSWLLFSFLGGWDLYSHYLAEFPPGLQDWISDYISKS